MVGFCDLVGTDIAPVSKKTAVKRDRTFFLSAKLKVTSEIKPPLRIGCLHSRFGLAISFPRFPQHFFRKGNTAQTVQEKLLFTKGRVFHSLWSCTKFTIYVRTIRR